MDDPQTALIAEQLRHANSRLQAQLSALQAEQRHTRELCDHRLQDLEDRVSDHETRLRSATDGVTQFKMWSGLANAGSGLFSVLALLKSFLSGAP
jgi:hypothetical protein